MLTSRIYHWAEQTPDQVAVFANNRSISYGLFAHSISRARGFFASRGVLGPGVAVILAPNLLDFWALSLALRSLGLDTAIAWDPSEIEALGLER